jgi:hypothetical protein
MPRSDVRGESSALVVDGLAEHNTDVMKKRTRRFG